MKKKLFMLIPVAAMLFSCTPSKAPSSSSSMSGGDSSSISESIYDDTSSEIEVIDDSPTTSYNEQTKKLLRDMLTCFGIEDVEKTASMVETYCLKLGVGDALLQKSCTFVLEQYELAQSGKYYENAEAFKKVYYDLLSILSSIDFSKIKDLLKYLDQTVMDSYKKRLDELTMSSLYPFVNHDEILDKVYEVYDNPDFRAAYDAKMLKGVTFSYTDKQKEEFKEEYDMLKKMSEEGVIPQLVYTFLEKNANKARDVIVKDLKIVVDSLYELLFAYSKKAMELSGIQTSGPQVYFSSYNYQFGNDSIFEYERQGSTNTTELVLYMLDLLNANKEGIKNVIRGLFERESSVTFILDTIRDLVLPLVFELVPSISDAQAQLRKTFLSQLAKLNNQNMSALINFIIDFIDKVDFSDFKKVVEDSHSEAAMEVADKYMKAIKDLIAATSSEDKTLISAMSAIFGVDILVELDNLASIFAQRKSLSEEAFQAQLDKWGDDFGSKVSKTLSPLFERADDEGGTAVPGTPSKKHLIVSVDIRDQSYNYYYYDFTKGTEITQDMIYLYIYDENYESIASGSMASLVEDGKISVNDYSFNTSSVGFSEAKFTFSVVDSDYEAYNFSRNIRVYPENYVSYTSMYIYGQAQSISNYDYVYAIKKGGEAYYYDQVTYQQVYLDTTTKGYHFIQSDKSWVVYYVYETQDASVQVQNLGFGILEEGQIRYNPYYYMYLNLAGVGETLVDSGTYYLPAVDILDFTVGKHTYTDPSTGFSYDYVIFKQADGQLNELSVYLDTLIPYMYKALNMEIPEGEEYDDFRNDLPSTMNVRCYRYYIFTDSASGFSRQISMDGVIELTNIKVENEHLKFTMNGENYSLLINKDVLKPLSEIMIY